MTRRVAALLPDSAIRENPNRRVAGCDQLMCTPEIARLITSRWISLVPSKMV
jgi:hypothetical protein